MMAAEKSGDSRESVGADPRVGLARERTGMASFRTQLALDRTTLAWIRTTLTMATFGFGLVGFFRAMRQQTPTPDMIQLHQYAMRFGEGLILLGIVATVLAAGSHWVSLRRLRQGRTPELVQWPLSITIALLVSVLGLAGLWTVMTK
jgi:uncharacterized membrane protein YidH (DUF202 family)